MDDQGEDDGRYFEDYTVVGELEGLVRTLSGTPPGFAFRDVTVRLCRTEPRRHKLLDCLDHYSLQHDDDGEGSDSLPMLFNLSSEYLCAQLDDHHQHQHHALSIGSAKFILSALTLAFPDLPCFVRFGRLHQYIIGKQARVVFSFVPDGLDREQLPKRCSAMVVLRLGVPTGTAWQRTMMTEQEGVQFPVCPADPPVREYELKGIFPQADSSKSLREELDALTAPILLLTARGSGEIVSQSEVFLARLADLHHLASQSVEGGVDDPDLHAKSKLRQVADLDSRLCDLYIKYIFKGGQGRLGIRLFKCIMACLYDNASAMQQCIPGVAGLWMQFVKRLRAMWDHRAPLPDVDGQPDWDEPLVFQKLSLLQYCLANAEHSDGENETLEEVSEAKDNGSTDRNRLGVKQPSGMFMQRFPDRPIMIPVTQSNSASIVMTSDQFAHYQSTLQKYSLEERSRLHAVPLLSDMQAFKAANPGCTLADFLRWHSPKDIVNDHPDDDQPELSERMKKGIWPELWEEAQPVPAALQPALFSPWREAEKALFYMEDLSVADLLDQCQSSFAMLFNTEDEHRLIRQSLLTGRFDEAELIAGEEERDKVQDYFLAHLPHVRVDAQYVAFPDLQKMLVRRDGRDWVARRERK